MIRRRILRCFLLFVGCVCNSLIYAQKSNITLKGIVLEKTKSNSEEALIGAKISFNKSSFAFVDKEGRFTILVPDSVKQIIIDHPHIGKDTVQITDVTKEIKIVYPIFIKKMKDVVIRNKRFTTEISLLSIQKLENIGSKELLKAACCNLSESFETTPSVDVSFTDAVTGYKQIQLLGLSGPNTFITRENIPDTRGLASITGLNFTPGQWIESMQLSKGTGSVVNGFEGLAGQINVEWRKPMEGDKQFYNIYQSNQGRTEANAYFRLEPKKGLYGNFFFHGKSQWLKVDQNKDHYQDQPMGNNLILGNRWMWFGKKGRELQFGAKYSLQDNWGGSLHFQSHENPLTSSYWGMQLNTKRLETWAKIGKVYELKPWKSMGLQLSFANHDQDFTFGRKDYKANEKSLYANYIFQSIIGTTNRVIKLGATFQSVHRDEIVLQKNFKNEEVIPGIYTEYAHSFSRKLNMVGGLRADYHNIYGLYITPRFHLRYAPHENLALRVSAGKAYRTASIFSENLGYFTTNRILNITPSKNKGFYQLNNESAYNMGVNATYKFKLNYRQASISMDYYYTHYLNQVIADWEHERFLSFYNSNKNSFAHSFQVQLDYEPIRKLDIRLAYRYNDVQATYGNNLLQRPLNAKHRAFLNASYTTRKKWSFDATLHWVGSKRIPSTQLNPKSLQMSLNSPSFFTLNGQVSKTFNKKFDAYLGLENAMNFMQSNPIIDAKNPFGNYFDGSLIWAPMMGRNIYLGMRMKIM